MISKHLLPVNYVLNIRESSKKQFIQHIHIQLEINENKLKMQ